MRRFFLATVIATLAFSVRADWEVASVSGVALWYVDLDTIREKDGIHRAWTLTNLQESRQGVWSYRVLMEFDCTEERTRALSVAMFDGLFAEGNRMSHLEPNEPWSYAAPRTNQKNMLDLVCNHKR